MKTTTMPPIKKYTFQHKLSNVITITLELYGDKERAMKVLGNYVTSANDWVLKK